MSESAQIALSGDRIEISQAGRETLLLTPVPSPSLIISPPNGEQITLSQTVQTLVLSEAQREILVIREEGGDTLLISEESAASSLYGRPYTQAEDGINYYYAWQHKGGTRWKAQRFELASLALITITGDNPLPVSLTDFQNLSF